MENAAESNDPTLIAAFKEEAVLAYKWTPLADAAGNKKAKVNLEKLTKRMSSAQLAEAKKKVKEWKQER